MKCEMKKDDFLWVGLCVAALALFFAQGLCIEPEGDDLSYGAYFNYYGGSLLYYPRWVVRHWAVNNGRAANYIAPLMLYFSPRWLLAAFNAVAASLYIFFAGRCLTVCDGWARAMLGALLLLTMAWWDSSTLFDVSFNYVWASAFGLWFAWAWMRSSSLHGRCRLALVCALAFIAGQMHEAMSVTLCMGIVAYYMMEGRWRHIPYETKWLLGCFFAGAVLCFFSPGIWGRFASERVADDPMWLLVAKSDFYALILVIVVAVEAVFRRARLMAAVRSPWLVFAVASLASMCMSAVGGIVGRSGWFAQTYALIALIWYYWPSNVGRSVKAAVWIVSVAAVGCWCGMTKAQYELGMEAARASDLFRQSAEGTFYMDHTPVGEQPWYTLMRPRGAVSNSDDYSRLIYAQEYDSTKQYVMLPAWAMDAEIDSLLSDEAFSVEPRSQCVVNNHPFHGFWRDAQGRVMVEVKAVHRGDELYYSEPLEARPGYRLPQWQEGVDRR